LQETVPDHCIVLVIFAGRVDLDVQASKLATEVLYDSEKALRMGICVLGKSVRLLLVVKETVDQR